VKKRYGSRVGGVTRPVCHDGRRRVPQKNGETPIHLARWLDTRTLTVWSLPPRRSARRRGLPRARRRALYPGGYRVELSPLPSRSPRNGRGDQTPADALTLRLQSRRSRPNMVGMDIDGRPAKCHPRVASLSLAVLVIGCIHWIDHPFLIDGRCRHPGPPDVISRDGLKKISWATTMGRHHRRSQPLPPHHGAQLQTSTPGDRRASPCPRRSAR